MIVAYLIISLLNLNYAKELLNLIIEHGLLTQA